LDPIVSPQLASVATMLLVSVFVLTNTVSTDGSVNGIYQASLQLAERTAGNASKSSAFPNGVKKLADDLMGGDDGSGEGKDANKNQNGSNQEGAPRGSQSKPKSEGSQQNKE
jgi:hypothetical protein